MREVASAARIREFMRRLGRSAPRPLSVFFTGGTSAVLTGWRETTVDIDLRMEPDDDDVLRAMVRLKTELDMNVELASPQDFIPPLPRWRERSRLIAREGALTFFHYDFYAQDNFYAQALAKIERGHSKDLLDVGEMLARGLVERAELSRLFDAIRPDLFRYPAIDQAQFAARVEDWLASSRR